MYMHVHAILAGGLLVLHTTGNLRLSCLEIVAGNVRELENYFGTILARNSEKKFDYFGNEKKFPKFCSQICIYISEYETKSINYP
jgi:hypothetical protein